MKKSLKNQKVQTSREQLKQFKAEKKAEESKKINLSQETLSLRKEAQEQRRLSQAKQEPQKLTPRPIGTLDLEKKSWLRIMWERLFQMFR